MSYTGIIYSYSAVGHSKSEMQRKEYDSIEAAKTDFFNVLSLIPPNTWGQLTVKDSYGAIAYDSGELPGGYIPAAPGTGEGLGGSTAGQPGGTGQGSELQGGYITYDGQAVTGGAGAGALPKTTVDLPAGAGAMIGGVIVIVVLVAVIGAMVYKKGV